MKSQNPRAGINSLSLKHGPTASCVCEIDRPLYPGSRRTEHLYQSSFRSTEECLLQANRISSSVKIQYALRVQSPAEQIQKCEHVSP